MWCVDCVSEACSLLKTLHALVGLLWNTGRNSPTIFNQRLEHLRQQKYALHCFFFCLKNSAVLLMMREFLSTEEALAFTTGAGGWMGSSAEVLFTVLSDSAS